MRLRLSILCGGLFAATALAAATATLVEAPSRAMRALRAHQTVCALPGLRCAPPNLFLHQREPGSLPDPVFGLPDPGMLVSSAWVDLSSGPVRLEIPATGQRFFAIQVIDERNATIAVADAASVGRAGGGIVIGPGDAAVRASGWVWIVARFAVTDQTDVTAVRDLQGALRIQRL